MKIKTVLLPEKIGTSGFNAKDHPELATVIECLRAQIPDDYGGYGGLDEYTLYGEIAIQTAIAYHEHMARWRSVADGELPEIGKTVIFTCYADKHSGFTDIAVGEWTGAKTLGDAISMDYGDDDDWLPCNYWKELPELPEVE